LNIHPTAIISNEATIAPETTIGPYAVITGKVSIGSNTVVESHVKIGSPYGEVIIGAHNHIQSGAMLGGPPQEWGYKKSYTQLVVGDHTRVGEGASLNLGSDKGCGVTKVGDRAFIMAYAHVAHDCQVGNDVVLTNLVQLAGHSIIEKNAIIGACCVVTQFVRIGEFSLLAIGAHANKDIPPYTIADGHWAVPKALNKIGLKRAGLSEAQRRNLNRAIGIFLKTSITIAGVIEKIEADCEPDKYIARLVDFLSSSKQGLARK
jgi:UDP-N-acetylglucosamine acyltransferase